MAQPPVQLQALPKLPNLPKLHSTMAWDLGPGFTQNPTPGPSWPSTPVGGTISGPITVGGVAGAVGGVVSTVTGIPGLGTAASTVGSLYDCLSDPMRCLLRIVLLILGLICVAGAIYLYKPTNSMIVQPAIKAGKGLAAGMVEA